MNMRQVVRHLAEASDKPSHHTDDILARFQRVKKIAEHVPRGSAHHDKLQREVVRLEKSLVERSKKNKELRRELRDIKLHHSVTETADLNKKFDRMIFLLGELAAKMTAVSEAKADTHHRRYHLEKKIKKSVKNRTHHLVLAEKKVAELERKHARLKKKDFDPVRLAVIEDRIKGLRKQIFQRRLHHQPARRPMTLPSIPAHRADMGVQPHMSRGTFKPIPVAQVFDPNNVGNEPVLSRLPSVHGGNLTSKKVEIPIDEVPAPPVAHKISAMPNDIQGGNVPSITSPHLDIPLDNVPLPPQKSLESEFPPPPAPQKKSLMKRLFGR